MIVGMLLESYGIRSILVFYAVFLFTSTLTFAFPAYVMLIIGRKHFSHLFTAFLIAAWFLFWMTVYFFGPEVGP